MVSEKLFLKKFPSKCEEINIEIAIYTKRISTAEAVDQRCPLDSGKS